MSQQRLKPDERGFPSPHPHPETVPGSGSSCCLQAFLIWTTFWLLFYPSPEFVFGWGRVEEVERLLGGLASGC